MSADTILKIAVNVPLSREFDYRPSANGPLPAAGCRVRVPFGRGQQIGMVLAHASESALPAGKLRAVAAVLDDAPLLSAAELWMIRFTSDYYHHPIGEVVAAALPALLRQGKSLQPTVVTIAISAAGQAADVATIAKRAPRQAELLELLVDAGGSGLDAEHLTAVLPTWRRAAMRSRSWTISSGGRVGRATLPNHSSIWSNVGFTIHSPPAWIACCTGGQT